MPILGRMKTGLRRPLGAATLLCAMAASASGGAAAAPPPERSVSLPLAAFRYANGVTVPGSDPAFTLYVPIFSSARRFDIDAFTRIPANVSSRARIELLIDGQPVASELAGTRRALELKGSLAAPHDRSSLDVTIRARLALDERHCERSEDRSLYLFVAPETKVTVAEATAKPTSVAGFFESYDGRFAVASDEKASANAKLQRLALGYGIHRVVRWRTLQLSLAQKPQADARTIVVGDYPDDLRVRDGILYASPVGVEAIVANRTRLVIGSTAEKAGEIARPDPRHAITLDMLGIGTRTMTGTGLLSFPVDTTLSLFNGRPSALHFFVELSHTALEPDDRARLDILAAGAILNSFTLSHAGGPQTFDVPIDDRFLRAAQNLTVRIDYLPHGQVCAGTGKALTASLLGASHFAWSNTQDVAPSVGDFFDTAFGTVGVRVQNEALAPAAFTLLERLGDLNPRVRRVTVETLAAPEAPKRTDDASIFIGSVDALPQMLPLALAKDDEGYTVTDSGGTVVFSAKGSDSFGLLQSFAGTPPKLVLTYAGDESVLAGIAKVPLAIFTDAGNDVLAFTADRVAYTRTAELARARTLPPPFIDRAWPMILAAATALVLLLTLVVRFASRVS